MKKLLITTSIFVAIAISAVSVIALANSSTYSSISYSTTSSIAEETKHTPTNLSIAEETKDTPTNQVSAEKTSEMIQTFNQNPYFGPEKVEFKEMTELVKLDKYTAIEKAKGIVGKTNSLEAKKITAFLVKYTNKEAPHLLPGSKIILNDYPTWIITFEGVHVQGNGPPPQITAPMTSTTTSVYVDSHVFIDANTGEMLGMVSHSSLNN